MPDFTIDDLIGVRFTHHGRNKEEGFDCYGLAIEVSRRLGHTLKDLWYEQSCPQTFTNFATEGIKINSIAETNEYELGNLIVFFDGNGNMVHIGVLLNDSLFIHSDIGGVKVMRLDSYFRKKWKVYKWQQ